MPIFISYSHKDREFTEKLALQLVSHNLHVWIDRWELSVGDSLVDRIQSAVEGASALLVVLSPESVESEWCKRELSSGLLRELEEKRVVVLPVLLKDCKIPIFARGKVYADFRTSFDEGLKAVLEGTAKITSASLSRIHDDLYYADWSINSKFDDDGNLVIRATFIQIPKDQPYTCLTEIVILGDATATQAYKHRVSSQRKDKARLYIWEAFVENVEKIETLRALLEDSEEKYFQIPFTIKNEGSYFAHLSSRRLGEDTGRDVLINVTGLMQESMEQMRKVLNVPAAKV